MRKKITCSMFFLGIGAIITAFCIFSMVSKKDFSPNRDFYLLCSIELMFIIGGGLEALNRKNMEYVETLEKRLSLWNTISYKVKGAGETAFNDLPIGTLVIDDEFEIMWSNNIAKTMLLSNLQNKTLKDVANGKIYDYISTVINDDSKDTYVSKILLFDKIYEITFIRSGEVIYLREITNLETLQKQYDNRTLAMGYINIDSLEESLSDFDVQGRSECQGKIIAAIAKWSEAFGAFVRAFSDSRYILMATKAQLLKMMENNFSILDEIKYLLKTTKAVRVTLSMGIVCEDIPIEELSMAAQDQLELALSRGGDQVVVRLNGKTTYYGAKTDPILKESKVEIRYKYQELESLILSSDKVFCIGHDYQDADAFGSSLAVYNLAIALGKEAYIIIKEDRIDETVRRVFDDIKKLHLTLYKNIITPEHAAFLATEKSLLLVVDCQSEKQLFLTPREFKTFSKVAIIDHHRKNDTGTISNPNFYYSEPAASSCVELIFTLLEFSDADLRISASEATWMMLGIVVDTNNFVYRTSSTTFEIASTLNKLQANMNEVKEYLKEDMTEKAVRIKLINSAERYSDVVMIAKETDSIVLEAPTIAKVSDELLSIRGIELAVTCAYTAPNVVRISARSLGKVNCQVLMEKLGGGGHLTAAATAIADKTIDEVVEMLKEKINIVLVEKNEMKVILIEDIKGKGKKGDIKEFQAGYANFLIKGGHAVIASPENMRILEQEKELEKAEADRLLKSMQELKEKIEAHTFTIVVKIGPDGHVRGTVTTKHIAEAIEKVIGEKIDKRKIVLNSTVTVLGSYEAQIQLHKDVIANVTFNVVESSNNK